MKTKISNRIFILPLAACFVQAQANDSILIQKTLQESARIAFEQTALGNPALKNLTSAPSLSLITVSGSTAPAAEARLPQLGTGSRFLNITATSLQHLNNHSTVWGHAAYENGKKYDVTWNETSDFLQLYPYVMADGRGGDLKYEQYELDGGYSAHIGRIHYGIEVGYRALSEYRDRDPRPSNTVADLYAKLGFGYALSDRYALAVGLDAGKYKQTNELTYYNELGSEMEYHLTGVGNDFARFSGSNNNTFYKGWNAGGSLSLAPVAGCGWSASAGYTFTKREKIITTLNRLPLNELRINKYYAALGYAATDFGVRLSGTYADRAGDDNIFGDASGNLYEQIGTLTHYKGSVADVKAEGFWTLHSGNNLTWDVAPLVSFSNISNKHTDSGNKLCSQDMGFGLRGKMTYLWGGNKIDVRANALHRTNLSTELVLNSVATESLGETIRHIEQYFSKGETMFGLGADYTIKVFGNKALSVGLDWQHGCYLSSKSDNRFEAHIQFAL